MKIFGTYHYRCTCTNMERKVVFVSYCNCTLEHVEVKIQINEKVGLIIVKHISPIESALELRYTQNHSVFPYQNLKPLSANWEQQQFSYLHMYDL